MSKKSKQSVESKVLAIVLDRQFSIKDLDPKAAQKLVSAIKEADEIRINAYAEPREGFDEPSFINWQMVKLLERKAGLDLNKVTKVPVTKTEDGKIDITQMVINTAKGAKQVFIGSHRDSLSGEAVFNGINFQALEK